MSARSTTLRPVRPPSMAKIPPVSVTRSASSMPSAGHVVADQRRRVVFGESQLGTAVDGAAQVHHLVVDGLGWRRSEKRRAPQRPSRSRAMWVTWISSVPA